MILVQSPVVGTFHCRQSPSKFPWSNKVTLEDLSWIIMVNDARIWVLTGDILTCGSSVMREHGNSVTWWLGASQHRYASTPLLTTEELHVEITPSGQQHTDGSTHDDTDANVDAHKLSPEQQRQLPVFFCYSISVRDIRRLWSTELSRESACW